VTLDLDVRFSFVSYVFLNFQFLWIGTLSEVSYGWTKAYIVTIVKRVTGSSLAYDIVRHE